MNPAWSIDNITWTELPGAYRFGGQPRSVERGSISLETDSGVKFVYNKFERAYLELIWILGETSLATFINLDETVIGDANPFYFSLIGDHSDTIFVRKEPGFNPIERDQPNKATGESLYDYTLKLTEELT